MMRLTAGLCLLRIAAVNGIEQHISASVRHMMATLIGVRIPFILWMKSAIIVQDVDNNVRSRFATKLRSRMTRDERLKIDFLAMFALAPMAQVAVRMCSSVCLC